MDPEIIHTLDKIRMNIEKCDILSYILKHRVNGSDINMDIYRRQGYTADEINIGIELVDLYIKILDLAGYKKSAMP